MKTLFFSILCLLLTAAQLSAQRQTDEVKTDKGILQITPITHASLVLTWDSKTIYVDPSGKPELFNGLPLPNIILITDIHGDHMDTVLVRKFSNEKTIIVAPRAVAELLPASLKKNVVVLNNGEETEQLDIEIKAVPMYNLPETADSRHPKGRGNGYVLEIGDDNIYISGDTEDIPEMRRLKDIDVAFVCMNLPYTMDIDQAASAVLDFKPEIVYPYHHRGQDINAFKKMVEGKNKFIDVRVRNWYPE